MPPRLPQEAEQNDAFPFDAALASEIAQCAQEYLTAAVDEAQTEADVAQLQRVAEMLIGVAELHGETPYTAPDLIKRFSSMGTGAITALLIRKQNAGLIVRVHEMHVVFEAFEASLPTKKVIACTGKLVCTFPGPCARIPRDVFFDKDFCQELASFIAHMNVDELNQSSAHSSKGGSKVVEVRDTAHPFMITDLLLSILAAVGSKQLIFARKSITKRLADDVIWKNAYAPWRRSPLWLIIRVALQTSVLKDSDYKYLMLYSMCLIAEKAALASPPVSNDYLSPMRVKICKRLQKLGDDAPLFVVKAAQQACQSLYAVLYARWKRLRDIEEEAIIAPLNLQLEKVQADTHLKLRKSLRYIDQTTKPSTANVVKQFTPNHTIRSNNLTLQDMLDMKLSFAVRGDIAIGLHDFERNIATKLDAWAETNPNVYSLFENMQKYHEIARLYYEGNPEDQSTMILTVLDMWRIIDGCATSEYPLLLDYPPEVSASLVEPLLLRHHDEIERAVRLTAYIRQRERGATKPSTLGPLTPQSFGICYYGSCPEMWLLMSDIEAHAEACIQKKREELEKKMAEREWWLQKMEETQHYHPARKLKTNRKTCSLCIATNKSNVKIERYERPLPLSDLEAENVVFELMCPRIFSCWRETTCFLLHDVLAPTNNAIATPSATQAYGNVATYMRQAAPLRSFISEQRITLASKTKSFHVAHYRAVNVQSVDEDSVIVNHGMTWFLYDSRDSFIEPDYHAAQTLDRCAYPFKGHDQQHLYTALNFAVNTTTHCENDVLATQAMCSSELSLHEFISFGCLRAGGHLQWFNVLRAYATRALSFHHDAVYNLIALSVQQIGCISTDLDLECHLALKDDVFCAQLLSVTAHLLTDTAGNWKECNTLKAIVLTLTRVLAFQRPPKHPLCLKAARLLLAARTAVYAWLAPIMDAHTVDRSRAVKRQLCEIASLCRLTFEPLPFMEVSTKDICLFVHCSIIIHDNVPLLRDSDYPATRILLDRNQRVSIIHEDALFSLVEHDGVGAAGLDSAIRLVWSMFRRNSVWTRMEGSNSRWISCNADGQQFVQFNALDGTLLVNGKPIGLLPTEITDDASYTRLFGTVKIHVVPSNSPGLEYKAIQLFGTWEISFGFRGKQVIIHGRDTASNVSMEYIHHTQFDGDLPSDLVHKCVHWRKIDNEFIDIRLESRKWNTQPDWRIVLRTRQMTAHLPSEPDCRLIDTESSTFMAIYQLVKPLEDPFAVHMTLHMEGRIRVLLPRFKLEFSVLRGSGELLCVTFPGMVVDRDQSLPTLYGLRSRLILTDDPQLQPEIAGKSPLRRRAVIIPRGDVEFSTDSLRCDVNVHIINAPSHQVRYVRYSVDNELGLLRNDSGLEAELYKAYLHAVTNNAIPDPLTRRTGGEEAVTILNSAACRSFMRLSDDALQLLDSIRSLTPVREYYPAHLRKMQTIHWRNLPQPQTVAYRRLADNIISYDRALALFYDGASSDEHPPDHLFCRAAARESAYPLTSVATVLIESGQDSTLQLRWRSEDSQFQDRSHYATALMVWSLSLPTSLNGISPRFYHTFFTQWRRVSTGSTDPALLSYSKDWLSRDDFGETWLSIFQTCLASPLSVHRKQCQLLFSLPAFSLTSAVGKSELNLLPWIIALVVAPEDFDDTRLPRHRSYDIADGITPSRAQVTRLVHAQLRSIADTPSNFPQSDGETRKEHKYRCKEHYQRASYRVEDLITTAVLRDNWPWNHRTSVVIDVSEGMSYFRISSIQDSMEPLLISCRRNDELYRFFQKVDTSLSTLELFHFNERVHPLEWFPTIPVISSSSLKPSLGHADVLDTLILSHRNATIGSTPFRDVYPLESTLPPCIPSNLISAPSLGQLALESLLEPLSNSNEGTLESQYGQALIESLGHLRQQERSVAQDRCVQNSPTSTTIEAAYIDACDDYKWITRHIECALEPEEEWEHTARFAGLWPSASIRSVLFYLTRDRWSQLTMPWKLTLVRLAQSLLRLQQWQRIIRFSRSGDSSSVDFERELQSRMELSVDLALQHPDWLLIQLDNDYRARDLQIRVALEMLNPSSNLSRDNIVIQLNMGEGKTSVIVPLISTSLANGETLTRIVIPKPLAHQMFQLLVRSVGVLANRRVYYLPFTRQMAAGVEDMTPIQNLYNECMTQGGLLVAQPEHILSARLLSIERVLHNDSMALKLHRWLDEHTRDILDESDELLHVRYQLIYTMGNQFPLEGWPDRWKIIEELLHLLQQIVIQLHDDNQDVTTLEARQILPWSFPTIRLSTQSRELVASIVDRLLLDVMDGRLPSLNMPTSPTLRLAIQRYLISSDDDGADLDLLKSTLGETMTFDMILVVRGMIRQGILLYTIQHRQWRVDYGLDLGRSPLAVPYRAKDLPSLRAEFAHPDLTILLTCLSYYYGGLTKEQMDISINRLLKLSNPKAEYDEWLKRIPADLRPPDLADPHALNPEDQIQVRRVHELFQFNPASINFYLNSTVFPRAAKQFEKKLPCSGWDLAEKKAKITTGFSGTNDNQRLLPTSVRHADPVQQGGTNARVLATLLHPQNCAYFAVSPGGSTLSGAGFIENITTYTDEIRVLLDVGAQILDMSNLEFARQWLESTDATHVEAAIFFNHEDELTTLARDGTIQLLKASPYRDQTGKCIVYLDDAHTRGTDLRLPRHWKAAVTLGRKVTKDRLVQGCMRMRQFGKGQTIVFFSPPQIDIQIRLISGKEVSEKIQVADVVRWAMYETFAEIRHYAPYWAQQGIDYEKRSTALAALPSMPRRYHLDPLEDAWLQPEARSLMDMYSTVSKFQLNDASDAILSRLRDMGIAEATSGFDVDEEQEREVAHEVEVQRQTERPPPVVPVHPHFSEGLQKLVESHLFHADSFVSIASLLKAVPYWSRHNSPTLEDIFDDALLATEDFVRTVAENRISQSAEFLKPVQWIISVRFKKTANKPGRMRLIIISQFEANLLMPLFLRGTIHRIRLHMYSPRVTKTMPIFDRLNFYCLPSFSMTETHAQFLGSFEYLILQINIIAGQLYPSSWRQCEALLDFLGIANDPARNLVSDPDRFVQRQNRDVRMVDACPFVFSSVRFLKELTKLRRKDQDFDLTPMGRLLRGHRLFERDIA